ncbi:MAG: D-TA family PLP-dependent enzyme [Bacteroidetes bacterium]|nr:MAG: D-TA family PLP-dependent enzyme [Bacteroidota bacterium]
MPNFFTNQLNPPMNWYQIANEAEVDSPALLVYPQRIRHNLERMIAQVGGDPARLMPHVKTHKMREVMRMQLEAGIRRFKCATIAELQMCLEAGASTVLMAYQLTGPKVGRFLRLARQFPHAQLASLVDDAGAARQLAEEAAAAGLKARIYLDVNNGQNRTGHPLDERIFPFYQQLAAMPGLELLGLHVYDGHIRQADVGARQQASHAAFEPVYALLEQIRAAGLPQPEVIAGGSPAFSAAAMRPGVVCSPGTTLLWDAGYDAMVPELGLQCAAVLMTRVISKPAPGLITTDLGHKSVASENALNNRLRLLNLTDYEPVGQSEEHLVLKVAKWEAINIGEVLYGLPFHVCPTVALYGRAHVVEKGE